MEAIRPTIEEEWYTEMKLAFSAPSFQRLKQFLQEEKKTYHVFPTGKQIFSAFNRTPFSKVKVVIIGQDPYHKMGQAEGLSFSVPYGVPPPPSLINIYKELNEDLGFPIGQQGHLGLWANRGVLLLNSVLTVREGEAGSHRGKGWEPFTDYAISQLNLKREHLVFLLWGKDAQVKAGMINREKHFVLEAAHPSPLSAYRGFFGCKHFSRSNAYLELQGIEPIDWKLCQEA
jgi:uracil-DNA glycosylase